MSIEPSNAFTVRIRPVMPPKAERVLPQPKLSMAEEAKQVRARFHKTWGRTNSQAGGEDAMQRRHIESIAEREDLARRALALITKAARTSAELRGHFEVTENKMRAALGVLRHENLITKRRIGANSVWELRSKGHPQANPVTVRGKVFPSMSACARHFGISVQAVACAVERGTTDNIGTRKDAAE